MPTEIRLARRICGNREPAACAAASRDLIPVHGESETNPPPPKPTPTRGIINSSSGVKEKEGSPRVLPAADEAPVRRCVVSCRAVATRVTGDPWTAGGSLCSSGWIGGVVV